ncbi:MAG: DsbA family protein [Anaerolineales bacterium]|nr:MAG: DsbA family protein [Anaerolineales bacterium]
MGKREEIREKRQREKRRNLLVATLVIAGGVIIITAMVISRSQAQIQSIITPAAIDFPQSEGMAMGDPNAPVIIEEFSDFQCPACQLFHEQTLEQVVDQYVKTGDVYYIFHNFPFIGKDSQTAALGGYCAAEQGLFWEYSNILFANQIGENVQSFSSARLEAMADIIGLDAEFAKCLREERYQDQVDADFLAAQETGVDSTPSFLINGELVIGAFPFETFQAYIEQALAGN